MYENKLCCYLLFFILSTICMTNISGQVIARQPAPARNAQSQSPAPNENCPQSRVTNCLASLMNLNMTALVETFKVYELLSFTDIDEAKLKQQAQVTTETCRVFNIFNDCTGGDFLKCFDKKKFIDIIQGFASLSSRPGASSQMSMLNEIAALITDQQIEFVGRAMIDACRKIQKGEVRLSELALCIRKDNQLVQQLASLAPPPSASTTASPYPLSASRHCRVFRCDVSRLIVHMLVRAAKNCSDENGAKFIFWIGQVSMTGVRTAPPQDVVIANGAGGTIASSENQDQCVIKDADFDTMKRTPAKTFADVGITRASQLCATEVATTTTSTTTVVFRYEDNNERQNYKVAIEATLDDLHNDEFWAKSMTSDISSGFCIILSFIAMLFLYL